MKIHLLSRPAWWTTAQAACWTITRVSHLGVYCPAEFGFAHYSYSWFGMSSNGSNKDSDNWQNKVLAFWIFWIWVSLFNLFWVCNCSAYIHVCVPYVLGAYGGQKKVLGFLELQMVLNTPRNVGVVYGNKDSINSTFSYRTVSLRATDSTCRAVHLGSLQFAPNPLPPFGFSG